MNSIAACRALAVAAARSSSLPFTITAVATVASPIVRTIRMEQSMLIELHVVRAVCATEDASTTTAVMSAVEE